ncbi:MAG TPA: histidine kinase [Streptosporangiaceae bacterium]|nr:histidine kinase [Streptosporangiaceae bacterium]
MRLDSFKLAHWLNARKYTVAQAADLAGLSVDVLQAILGGQGGELGEKDAAAVACALSVAPSQLEAAADLELTVVHHSAERMRASRRPIQRDGIHFYNYYTLAAPDGRVAPVILDILCPADRLPALNNGHLEPAITVNLGPGDIHGRWGEELTPETWQVLAANTGHDRWITGDSYIEPSYCPHSYSLASGRPARIVSYTAHSNLAALVTDANTWSGPAFDEAVGALSSHVSAGVLLDTVLARRVHTRASAAAVAGIPLAHLEEALTAPLSADGMAVLRCLGRAIGFDYRFLLPPDGQRDAVGKTWATVEDARAGQRQWGGYQAASMAAAAHLPDLAGTFLRVREAAEAGDFVDHTETHYVVIDGHLTLEWEDRESVRSVGLTADGSAWVGPFVRHRWRGDGAVLKFGSGAHVSYLDWLELSSTFEPARTLRRGRRDLSGWGYE